MLIDSKQEGELSAVLDDENVVRILSAEWVVQGQLQLSAFALQPGETYISVNRPRVSSFAEDVKTFVTHRPEYRTGAGGYRCALLSVRDIRGIAVEIDDLPIAIDVEVESRAKHTKSHAGIFTRYEGKNVKTGQTLVIKEQEKGVSSDDILLDVRYALLGISAIEDCIL